MPSSEVHIKKNVKLNFKHFLKGPYLSVPVPEVPMLNWYSTISPWRENSPRTVENSASLAWARRRRRRFSDKKQPEMEFSEHYRHCRAGHFRYFLNFFNNKKWFFCTFLHISAPVLFKKPTPSQISLIKIAKNHFLLLKILKIPKVPSSVR